MIGGYLTSMFAEEYFEENVWKEKKSDLIIYFGFCGISPSLQLYW